MEHRRVATPPWGVVGLKIGFHDESLFHSTMRKPPVREVRGKEVPTQSEKDICHFGTQHGVGVFCQFGQGPVNRLYADTAETKPSRKGPAQRTKAIRPFQVYRVHSKEQSLAEGFGVKPHVGESRGLSECRQGF